MDLCSSPGLPTSLALDLDGDGIVDRTIPAVALSGSAASDFTPPIISTITPSGRATVGAVPINWSASDADSGLAQSFAMVDRMSSGGGTRLDAPGPLALSPGTHTIEVFAEDRAGNAATRVVTLTADAYQFLQPLLNGRQQGQGGRTLPVRFVLNLPDGTPVEDASVTVTLLDGVGTGRCSSARHRMTALSIATRPDTTVTCQRRESAQAAICFASASTLRRSSATFCLAST